MAQIFNAFIYGVDSPTGKTDIAAAGGESNGFSPPNCHFYPTDEVRGNAQVTCNAIIEVYPHGLQTGSKLYYTAKTVAELITLANA